VLGSVTAGPFRPNFTGVFETFVAQREADPVKVARSTALNEGEAYYKQLKRQPGGTGIIEVPGGGFGGIRPIGRGVVSDGDLTTVRIIGNQIRNMGASGITTAHFFDLVEGEGDFITVHGLEIEGNRIEDCLRVVQQPVPEQMVEDTAVGGIALANAEDVVIRDNTIERNGALVRMPTCGIFLLHSVGLEIHRNRIRHNGMPPQEETKTLPGRRGGIVIGFAEVPTREVRLGGGAKPRRRQDGTPAISIQDNVVIAPEGRAIEAVSLGAVTVQDNQLTSIGSEFRNRSTRSPLGFDVAEGSSLGVFTSAFGGAVVLIFNLGVSNEIYGQLFGFSGLNIADTQPQPVDPLEDRGVLVGGNIQFVDNQVVLDALDGVTTIVLSAITLLTLDDVALSDNQSDCDLVLDIALMNALVLAFSTRTTSNRFKEGLFNALFSAITIAYLNTTTDNQGTHCFVRAGNPVPLPGQNTALVQVFNRDACANAANLEKKLQKTIFGV
jgi:parallel beta helix pectate lyase-like protein